MLSKYSEAKSLFAVVSPIKLITDDGIGITVLGISIRLCWNSLESRKKTAGMLGSRLPCPDETFFRLEAFATDLSAL